MLNYFIILPIYAICAALSVRHIFSTKLFNINFGDGLLAGFIFFIAIPLGLTLPAGGMQETYFQTGALTVEDDLVTYLNLLLGWAVVLGLAWTLRRSNKRFVPSSPKLGPFPYLILAILFCSLIVFPLLGKTMQGGGHQDWYAAKIESFSSNPLAVILENFSSAFRTAIFGILVFLVYVKKLKPSHAVIVGLVAAIINVALSYNRVTIVYFVVALFMIYPQYWLRLLLGFAAFIPFASYGSRVWADYRSLSSRFELNPDDLSTAFDQAVSYSGQQRYPYSFFIDGAFEGGNLLSFNYVVHHYPSHFEALWGYTFILRPFTVLLPGFIWSEKPPVFGTILGKQIEGRDMLSINSTMMGEAYANFLYGWPIALFLMLLLYGVVFSAATKRRPVYAFWAFFTAFAAWRFDIAFTAISIVAMVAVELFVSFLEFVLTNKNRRGFKSMV